MSKLTIKERAKFVDVSAEYDGYSDYWCGNGRRWDDNAGCLFASYDRNTTYGDLVDQWIDDFNGGGDCDSFPDWVDSDVIFEAIKNALRCSLSQIVDDNATPAPVCRGCGEELGCDHCDDCSIAMALCAEGEECEGYEPSDLSVTDDDCDDCEYEGELPQYIILVEVTCCPVCNGCPGEGNDDDLCDKCAEDDYTEDED